MKITCLALIAGVTLGTRALVGRRANPAVQAQRRTRG